jgi:aldehyde dehydrogenase (NAD+)
VRVASEYISGDPSDEAVRVGTVIDEAAAIHLEQMIQSAVAGGARLLSGGTRRGALLAPTVLSDVPRTAEIACKEAFGPIAKIIPVQDLEDAIGVCNASQYGLATSVVTRSIEAAVEVVKRVRTGTVNVNEVPGYRLESTPFGGVKDSGLGVKEGVVELTRWYTSVKTFSLPW